MPLNPQDRNKITSILTSPAIESEFSAFCIEAFKKIMEEDKAKSIEVEHLLRALLDEENFGIPYFEDLGVDMNAAKKQLDAYLATLPKVKSSATEADDELANIVAEKTGQKAPPQQTSSISPTLMKFFTKALQNLQKSAAMGVLESADFEDFIHYVINLNPKTSFASELLAEMGVYDLGPALSKFSTHLNKLAENGNIDPVIARDNEIKDATKIMLRRKKSNPVFVGDAGVGKTALAYGLAQAIVDGKVPKKLRDAHIFELDMNSMVAGTKHRGEFEERMEQFLQDVEDFEAEYGPAYIFIDELHSIVAAGGAEGATDASQILKPALASGKLKVIGATTRDEYHKFIEKDAALERRFGVVETRQPSIRNTLKMLYGSKGKYEEEHGVTYTDEALQLAVELSAEFTPYRKRPDCAFDLLDEAGAAAQFRVPEERADTIVTGHDICVEISKRAKIDIDLLTDGVSASLKNALPTMQAKIFGQNEPLERMLKPVKRYYAGINNHVNDEDSDDDENRAGRKPVASFILAGPSGVGKTKAAKELGSALGRDIHIEDMSEYKDSFQSNRITGSPPGYVGYGERNKLLDFIKRNPNGILLFDEIEKASKDIQNMLLQVLDEGKITDGEGNTYDLSNMIIILTTNLGSKMKPTVTLGRSPVDQKREFNGMAAIEKYFSPEFLGRITDVIPFNFLTVEDMPKVAQQTLGIVNNSRINKKKNVRYELDASALAYIAKEGFSTKSGARSVEKKTEDVLGHIATERIPDWTKNSVVKISFNEASIDNPDIQPFKVKIESTFGKAASANDNGEQPEQEAAFGL